jgi:hypothetical protein
MAFAPIERSKWRCITHLPISLYRTQSTDSAEEPDFLDVTPTSLRYGMIALQWLTIRFTRRDLASASGGYGKESGGTDD